MLEGPGGLKLVVSVEKATEVGWKFSALLGSEFDLLQFTLLHSPCASRSFIVYLVSEAGTSFNPMTTPQVIGALANANDDPYKPKMECPTCGLLLIIICQCFFNHILYRHNFSTHYRIHTAHTGEKPYICPSCGYSTITKRNLDRHIENHHVRTGGSKGPATRRIYLRHSLASLKPSPIFSLTTPLFFHNRILGGRVYDSQLFFSDSFARNEEGAVCRREERCCKRSCFDTIKRLHFF
ncbi:unnamed protein product [Haemonchus placei]|uniref:C2H2-type domain-containing protein n=1 Tax=Haemonchus placei TaxID=6290 RepID=A0A0N4WD64_HAEPC|nr:unnamed protein product [Haemonchus placei]